MASDIYDESICIGITFDPNNKDSKYSYSIYFNTTTNS